MIEPEKLNFPNRKISETLIDFARPILNPGDREVTKQFLDSAFVTAITVWNAVGLDAVEGGSRWLDRVLAEVSGRPGVQAIIQFLVRRKREEFGDDMRVIGDFRVTMKDDEFNLWAEARDPRHRNQGP